MDAALLVLGILVVLFDAYAYKKYMEGRERLESVYSSKHRALAVKKQFDEDQAENKAIPLTTQPTSTQSSLDVAFIAPPAAGHTTHVPAEIEIPLRQQARQAVPESVHPIQPARDVELALLRSEFAALQKKIFSLEKTIAARPVSKQFTPANLDAKEAELQRMFFKRQIDPETYRAMRAEITRMRLGI